MKVSGIHHITAISSDAKKTFSFYTEILGLRLVKKSVNQDDPKTYHLFFGNETGSPGMDLTFFPFQPVRKGENGPGFVTRIDLSIPKGTLSWWKQRFQEHSVEYKEIDASTLLFWDFDGQSFALRENENISPEYENSVWETHSVKKEFALRSFHSAQLEVYSEEDILPILELLGYEKRSESKGITELYLPAETIASEMSIKTTPSHTKRGISGAGTVHHIAFSVKGKNDLSFWRERLLAIGLRPTEDIERYYFTSVYFQTPAGILCELATENPGFTVDEPVESLGERLALPPFLEQYREAIEENLPPLLHTV